MAHFNNYDRALVIFSLLSYLTDIATDIALIVYFLSSGHAVWGALTLSFVALSAILMQVFSFHWHVTDRTLTWRTFVVHILFLAPTHRYIAVYRRGMKSRKTGRMEDLEAAYRGLNDISILRLFETFLESAPQLILQLYIVLSDLDNYNTLLGFSLFFSLTSVAWAMTSYMDALHLAYQKLYKRSWMAMFMHVLWQSGMVTARVVSIVLFTTVFQAYVAIPLAVHFVIMMVWITRLNPEFGTTKCERRLFTVISSVIHIFCFLNLKDGMARYRMAFFYILVLVETAMYMTVWYMCKTFVGPIWFDVTAFSVVFGSFAFGTLCMLLYYGCCHSSGPAPLRKKPQEFLKPAHHSYRPTGIHTPSYAPRKEQEPEKQQFTKPVRQPIFDVSTTSARINQWLSASLDLSKEGLTDNPDRMLDPAIRTRNHGDWVAGADGLSLTGSGANGSAGRSLLDGSRNMSGLQVSSTGDQSHLGRSALATSLQERSQHSIPDQNLIEMFSQIRHDPSFVSNTSMSDSFFDQTRRQSGGKDALSPQQNSSGWCTNEQQNLLSEISIPKGRQSRVSNNSDLSLKHERSPYSPQNRLYQYDQHNSLNELPYSKDRHSRPSNDSSRSTTYEQSPLNSGYQNNYISPKYSSLPVFYGQEQVNPCTEMPYLKGRHSRLSNDSARSAGFNDSLNGNVSTDRLNPVNISPLDPSKLWEESQNRLAVTPKLRDYMNMPSADSDTQLNRSDERKAVVTVTPDECRGITHLSLSYSDLNSADNTMNKQNSSSCENSRHVPNSSYYNKYGVSKSIESINESKNMGDSQLLSFSDTSLPLPDSSSGSRHRLSDPQPDIVQSVSGMGNKSGHGADRHRGHHNKNSPGDSGRMLSTGSLSSRECSSYLSDRGISSSDKGLSSSNQTSDNSALRSRSSGFQSDDSNFSMASPSCLNFCAQNQFQSTPLVENEITSITSAPSELPVTRKKRSLDNEVFEPSFSSQSDNPYRSEAKKRQFMNNPTGALFFSESNEQMDSPSLPPLRVSRRSSSAESGSSGRFFKDPTLDDDDISQSQARSDQDLSKYPNLSSASLRQRGSSSTFMEKSSLSALLSDMSNSRSGGMQSSEETLSLSSDPDSLKRNSRIKQGDSPMKKAASLPYLDCNNEIGELRSDLIGSYASLPYRKQVSDYLCKDDSEKNRLQELYSEYSEANTSTPVAVTSDKGARNNGVPNYVNIDTLNIGKVKNSCDSPFRLGTNVEKFSRERWRTSLDEEMRDQLEKDMERLAPKKLHQIRAKSEVPRKKISPVNITEYAESPYKFRNQPKSSAVYENIKSVSRDSLTESVSSANTSVHPDYENLFVQSAFLAKCPIATPESLSDSLYGEEPIEHTTISDYGKKKRTLSGVPERQEEVHNESLSDESVRSIELGRNKSPINISGVNSAFRQVKRSPEPGNTSPGTATTNATYVMPNDSVNSTGEWSLNNRTADNQFAVPTSIPRRRSNVSHISQGSTISDTASSSFQWTILIDSDVTSATGMLETTNQTPRNFLKMAGKNALSFSMSSYPRDDSVSQCSSQHSYSDSIPWEDSANKSSSFQAPDNLRSTSRQPLKALENTPVFSPIYGQDKGISLEMLSRKRFMSTPKLSTGSEMSVSRMSDESGSMVGTRTPHRRRSSGINKRTFADNTSTWSSQSEGDLENMVPSRETSVHDQSHGLNKTTYI